MNRLFTHHVRPLWCNGIQSPHRNPRPHGRTPKGIFLRDEDSIDGSKSTSIPSCQNRRKIDEPFAGARLP